MASSGRLGEVQFTRVPPPTTEEVERLVVRVADRVERWLTSQGYGPEEEACVDEDDTMLVLQEASAAHRAAVGERAGKKTRRMQMLGGREFPLPPRCASYVDRWTAELARRLFGERGPTVRI